MSETLAATSSTAQMWARRAQVINDIVQLADVPALSQIINLSTGERLSLSGGRWHILDDAQWSKLLTLLVLTHLIIRRPEHVGAVRELLELQLKMLLETLPQSHQDDVVNHALHLLQGVVK